MLTEQFIQDALCNEKRIAKVANQLKLGWKFEDGEDIVNQEFSFVAGNQGGRIDILSTMNGKKSALLIEVKAGAVGNFELAQLDWYVKNWDAVRKTDASLSKVNEVVGVLLAEGFSHSLNPKYFERKNRLVKFELDGTAWPFSVVVPEFGKDDDEPAPPKQQRSNLNTLAGHRDYLLDEAMREKMERICDCFLDEGDPRREWVCQNPQGGHVAIHYKGEYVIAIFVKRRVMDVWYAKPNKEGEFVRIGSPDDENIKLVRAGLHGKLAEIDEAMRSLIPPEFVWKQAITQCQT